MKKTILFLIAVLFPLVVMAQADPIDKLFDKYGEKDGFTSVYITGKMFQMVSQMELDDPEVNRLLRNISRIRILASEDSKETGINFLNELKKDFPFGEFEELMTVREKDQDVKFLVKESGNNISHLVLIVSGEDNVIISIEGLIDMKNISRLSKGMGLKELEHLEKADKQ